VDSLDIEKMGLKGSAGENGRPSYHPKELVKLYLYGYMNHMRSSRQLEKGIQRSEYQQYIASNKQRIENNKDYYRRRQAIVEHPYGTIKRQ